MGRVGETLFVDANVWFSRTLRDWIGMTYVAPIHQPLFEVYWSEDVLAELLFHLRKKHPDWSGERITGIRDRLADTFSMGRVIGFDTSSYTGPDPHDAHVHAAAVACGATILLTWDTTGFGPDRDELPYEVLTPDEFLVLLDDAAPQLVASVTREMRDYWIARTGEADLPRALERERCPEFARRVRLHLQRDL